MTSAVVATAALLALAAAYAHLPVAPALPADVSADRVIVAKSARTLTLLFGDRPLNPQGAFHDASGVHWLDLGVVGLAWFVPVAAAIALTVAALAAVVRRLR